MQASTRVEILAQAHTWACGAGVARRIGPVLAHGTRLECGAVTGSGVAKKARRARHASA